MFESIGILLMSFFMNGCHTSDEDADAAADHAGVAAAILVMLWNKSGTKAPTVSIFAYTGAEAGVGRELIIGSATNAAIINLKFTISEPTSNFGVENITATNGNISSFTGSGKSYTAIFTAITQGACTIDVNADSFTDAANNSNAAADQFNWTFDNVAPTVSITAFDVVSGNTPITDNSRTNSSTIGLTFTISKPTSNFVVEHITVTNGNISAFGGSGGGTGTSYDAIFTTFTPGDCAIGVNANSFTDAANNSNAAADQFNWTFDNVAPTVSIAAYDLESGFFFTDNSSTRDSTIGLTFTISKPTSNFVVGDITATNGNISSFTGSGGGTGTSYDAIFTTFTPGDCAIGVNANSFTDAANNNNAAADQFNWTFDNVAPTVIIAASVAGSAGSGFPTPITDNSSTNASTIDLTFTISESTSNFVVGDITTTNGNISSFTGSGTSYTAIFTPITQGDCAIGVNANSFTDAANNNNAAADQFNWTFDNVAPTVIITASDRRYAFGVPTPIADNSNTNASMIDLIFTISEPTSNFVAGDITITNGTISDFGGTGTYYYASFKPITQGDCTIDVEANSFTDAANNNNAAADQFNFYTFNRD